MKVVRKESPDLVLLDIIMPDVDGYQLCKEIKESYGSHIPVILFTAQPYEKEFIKDSYQDFGADDYIVKPFEAKDLLDKIENILKD